MHGALDVPALVVIVVERLKIDIVRTAIDSRESSEIREPHTGTRCDGGPTFHAEMVHAVPDPREAREVLEREAKWTAYQAIDLERPLPTRLFVPHRNAIGHVIRGDRASGCMHASARAIDRGMAEEQPLHVLVPAFGNLEKPARR